VTSFPQGHVSVNTLLLHPFSSYIARADRIYEYDIHLRSLTTNGVHLDAAKSIMKALNKNNIDHARLPSVLKVQNVGGKYSIVCYASGSLHPLASYIGNTRSMAQDSRDFVECGCWQHLPCPRMGSLTSRCPNVQSDLLYPVIIFEVYCQ
jgi:hypothetical protein